MDKFADVMSERMQLRRKACAHPTRLRILELLSMRPQWTAKELAQELGVPANGLYYHLRLMEESELVEVVGTQASGRMVERIFGAPKDERITWTVEDSFARVTHLGALVDLAKAEAEEVLHRQARQIETGEDLSVVQFGKPSFDITRHDLHEFDRRVHELVAEFNERAESRRRDGAFDVKRFEFAYVMYEKSLPAWYTPEASPDQP